MFMGNIGPLALVARTAYTWEKTELPENLTGNIHLPSGPSATPVDKRRNYEFLA